MAHGQPVVFLTVNDTYSDSARIAHIIWEGSTAIGDQVELVDADSGLLLWVSRAADTNTYLGMNLSNLGVGAPKGFRASVLDSGRLLIYLKEE